MRACVFCLAFVENPKCNRRVFGLILSTAATAVATTAAEAAAAARAMIVKAYESTKKACASHRIQEYTSTRNVLSIVIEFDYSIV